MRAALLLLVVAVAGGLAFWLWAAGETPSPGPRDPDSPSNPAAVEQQSPPAGESATSDQPIAGDAARAVPTRTAVDVSAPTDLADAPTACLLAVDHATGQPVAGAVVQRLKGGAEIAFTDERGFAELPLAEREQLAVVAERYLMRMAATRLGSSRSEPQRVELVRDQWSVWHRLELRGPGGRAVAAAFARIDALGDPEPLAHPDPVVARARAEDDRLRTLFAPLHESIRIENGEELRFASGRPYALEVAAVDDLAARIRLDAADRGRTLRVDLQPGLFVAGVVQGDKGRALAGATLSRQGGDPLGLICTTTANGRFAFGPLPAGDLTLLVRHPDHEPTAFATGAGRSDVVITLHALPSSTLRGRVRRRPGLEPIEGATVSWTATSNPPLTARTAADGTFTLPTTGDVAGRLLVSAPACIVLEELVAPGAPFADYDVLPALTADRLAGRLTAVLAGVVFDAQSRPLANAGVRWVPAAEPQPQLPSGRRTVSGLVLQLPLTVTSRADGSFELETDRFGPGRLCLLVDGRPDAGIETTAVAGTKQDDYRLRR
ncbi:MAG: carboxypeptidase regulatory-like domain-containing protein [Planctomycetes bacterium]|nr:carboxypeptidase regulatory-like domain-containing protein [Planctomycetota bacterium]